MKSKKISLILTSAILIVTLCVSTVINSKFDVSNKTDKSEKTTFTEKEISNNKLLSNSATEYAHSITVNNDGTFNFLYDGETYKNEYERLLAQDGFMYGVNWDWFGTWQQQITNLGTDNIINKPSYFRAEYVKRALYNLKALGFNTLANWIGPGGAYTYDESGLVTGLDETFVKNLTALLEACRETEMDFVPGLLTHNYGGRDLSSTVDDLEQAELYHKYFRYYYDETARKAYIDNGINKILDILKEYQDVIPVVALTIENGSRTNDVNNGMLYNVVAPTWEDFATLNNAMHDAVKEAMPNMLTSVEDIGGWEGNIAKYNDLKVDIQGFNFYTTADFPDISSMMLTKPAYLGEFDVFHDSEDYKNTTQEYLDNIRVTFYEKAVKQGYLGAFYYPFHYNETSAKATFFKGSSVDRYDELRAWVVSSAYSITDLKHEYRGTTGLDVPALFYNNGSQELYFLGGRNVDHYVLERSDNGASFKVVASNISPVDNMINNGLMYYKDKTLKENVTYIYRVTAVYENDKKTVSKNGNAFELFVPEESFVDSNGNYMGGFEQGGLTGTDTWPNSNGWIKDVSWTNEPGQVKSGDARTGNNSFIVDVANGIGVSGNYDARWRYNITLKGNTQYTLSMWSKNSNAMFGMEVQNGDGAQIVWTYPATGGDGEWVKREITFMTPSDGRIRLRMSNIQKSDALVNLDDISIKESR